ncbi:MAG: hypothetical protein ACXVRQ_06265, partial [Gaiellaceae bacterium]
MPVSRRLLLRANAHLLLQPPLLLLLEAPTPFRFRQRGGRFATLQPPPQRRVRDPIFPPDRTQRL